MKRPEVPEQDIFELLKDSKELTSLPQVLAEVVRITNNDDCGAAEVAEVIMKDPALSARILRISNSAYYGAAREIGTVSQAVVTMGLRAVKALSLSVGLYRLFDTGEGTVNRLRFWRHSLEVAIASREIAIACSYRPAEEAFVCGLLHDIGILVLEANFEDRFKRLWKQVEAGESLTTLEQAHWGTDHARVAKFLLDQWRVPKYIGEAVAVHHDPFGQDQSLPQNRLGRIVSLANRISKFRIYQTPPLNTDEIAQIEKLADSLGIGATEMASLQERVISLLIKEAEFLEIKIGSMTDLLIDANTLIYKQYLLVESVLRENRRMQAQIARDQVKKAALESLKTITATLSHYINNASATILGRAQLVELAISKGTVADTQQVAGDSMGIIIKSVETISLVLEELKKLSSFDTTHYHDDTDILNIEERLRQQMSALGAERRKPVSAGN
ncbi:MAG: HDOD domain-containing protein [candidate division Zixibacteria bacterium]|nr:HDOD domain-containing protein [candidate division Zixibacteria bacterium]